MKIYSLIITYYPDMSLLCRVISSLEKQVEGICIIDNGGLNESALPMVICELFVKHLENNQGLAKATNIGFDFLSTKLVDYVLLSDQDTIYPADYVKSFVDYVNLNGTNSVAAFCPFFYDANSSEYKSVYVQRKGFVKRISARPYPIVVFQAIASGFIIDIKKFYEIGGMNEDLFIDYVDFEWCWRVNKVGYKIICLPVLKIVHHLGSGVINFISKKISIHSSLRYYYITRNTFYLSLYTPYLSKRMRWQLFFKACVYPFGYTILCKPHLKIFRYTFLGVIHGLFGKLGKYK